MLTKVVATRTPLRCSYRHPFHVTRIDTTGDKDDKSRHVLKDSVMILQDTTHRLNCVIGPSVVKLVEALIHREFPEDNRQ